MRRGAGDLADPRELASRKWKKSRFWRFFFKIIGFHLIFACLRRSDRPSRRLALNGDEVKNRPIRTRQNEFVR
jgi:hypothetical protein